MTHTGQDLQAIEQIDEAIDKLLSANPPGCTSGFEFRGARFDAGLAWVHLPCGLGGLGLQRELNAYVERRLARAGAPPPEPSTFFMHLAAPTIVVHGTDDQKRRLLRPMFTGQEIWCQLFSEPGSGSDLAGLSTRAVRDGDVWRVDGQKVWTTVAHLADWGMLVTRTDPDLPKHKGLTYFIVDMRASGVEVRPLRQITGEAEFNEVYLTDVLVPDRQRVGDVGEGWRVSLTTLMNEREAIGAGDAGSVGRGGAANDAVALWRTVGEHRRTAAMKGRLMRLWMRAEVGRLTNLRAAERARSGNPGPERSVAKLEFAELNKELYAFCVDLLGADGLVGYDYTFRRSPDIDTTGTTKGLRNAFLRVRANSIEGGTSEILRNILGEQVLGLPGEPRVDKDLPWSRVPRG